MKIALAIIAAVALASCNDKDTSAPVETSNPSMRSMYLGDVDGCRVYWVSPTYGNQFNFVRCPGQTTLTSTEWSTRVGKTTTSHRQQIETQDNQP